MKFFERMNMIINWPIIAYNHNGNIVGGNMQYNGGIVL